MDYLDKPSSVHFRFFVCLILALGCLCPLHGIMMAEAETDPAFYNSHLAFWFCDVPALSPIMRIVFYAGLLIVCETSFIARPHLGDSPLQAPALYEYTLTQFFSLEGAMRIFEIPGLNLLFPGVTVLKILRMVLLTSFIFAIIGFLGVIPNIIIGVIMIFFHGVCSGCIGTSHRWYVPVYCCVVLSLCNGNSEYSLDGYLSHRIADYYFVPPTAATASTWFELIQVSGLGRKLALWAGMCTLFYGGLTKIFNAGLIWMDGRTLAYYVSSEENGGSITVKKMIMQNRLIALLLSIGGLALELSAIVPLFIPQTRFLFFISAVGFHFGIWLTMWPNYLPQSFAYILMCTWPGEERYVLPFSAVDRVSKVAGTELAYFAFAATFFIIFLTWVCVLRIEYWPFTGVPMYSFYRDDTFNYRYLLNETQAQNVAREHHDSGYPNALAWSNQWIVLRVVDVHSNPLRVFNLKDVGVDVKAEKGSYSKQWRRTLHNIAAADMVRKPDGYISLDTLPPADWEDYPAQKWLRHQLPIFRSYHWWKLKFPDWMQSLLASRSENLQIQLVAELKNGPAILGSVPWTWTPTTPTGNQHEKYYEDIADDKGRNDDGNDNGNGDSGHETLLGVSKKHR